MESVICELCNQSIPVLDRTKHGVIVSHRKSKCTVMQEIRLKVNKDYLLSEYVIKNRTALDISRELGFRSGTNFVDDQLRKFGIPKKSCKQQASLPAVIERRKRTTHEKYGVDNVSFHPEILQKIKDNQPSAEIVGPKISESLKSKTPEEWKRIKEKAAKTFKERYGIDNISQREDVRQKMSMTHRGFSSDQVEEWKRDKEERSLPQEVYSGDFHNKKFRIAIMQEQNWKCALCGRARSEFRDMRFPLHHIDRNKSNNNRQNLIFLCNPCHGGVHGGKENFEASRKILEEKNQKILDKVNK